MASTAHPTKKHKVTIVGSGNWGSAVAKIVAENAAQHTDLFEPEVQMWVFEEEVTVPKDAKHYDSSHNLCNGSPQKLTEVINALHENVKYLPGITLPKNLIANPDIVSAVQDSTFLVFNLPHQFIARICGQIKGKVLPFARGVSCIKGVDVSATNGIRLFSESIGDELGIYCGALSGANIASEVAKEKWSETTVAYEAPIVDSRHASPEQLEHQHGHNAGRVPLTALPHEYPPLNHENVKRLFHRPYFHVRLTNDDAGVQLAGALKNVVALAAGWVDGLGWGDNAKAAVMRVGLVEEVRFGHKFFHGRAKAVTFTDESCGVADMITSCSGGRNFRCAKMSVERNEPLSQVEERELNGQKLQGTGTAYELHEFLKTQKAEGEFPLFTAVYQILEGQKKASDIPDLFEEKHQ